MKQIVAAAIVDSLNKPTRLLTARRTAPAAVAGMWEFPGGKIEPGESCHEAVHREITEELGVSLELGSEIFGPLEQGWQLNDTAAMRVWFAEISSGSPEPLQDHDQLLWVDLNLADLEELPWIPADLPIVRAVLAESHAGATR